MRRPQQKDAAEEEMTTIEWDYIVEEVPSNASAHDLEKLLSELGLGGWELTTLLTLPGGHPHANNGASRTYLLLKQPLKKS
jgi:hypothetical protein